MNHDRGTYKQEAYEKAEQTGDLVDQTTVIVIAGLYFVLGYLLGVI